MHFLFIVCLLGIIFVPGMFMSLCFIFSVCYSIFADKVFSKKSEYKERLETVSFKHSVNFSLVFISFIGLLVMEKNIMAGLTLIMSSFSLIVFNSEKEQLNKYIETENQKIIKVKNILSLYDKKVTNEEYLKIHNKIENRINELRKNNELETEKTLNFLLEDLKGIDIKCIISLMLYFTNELKIAIKGGDGFSVENAIKIYTKDTELGINIESIILYCICGANYKLLLRSYGEYKNNKIKEYEIEFNGGKVIKVYFDISNY